MHPFSALSTRLSNSRGDNNDWMIGIGIGTWHRSSFPIQSGGNLFRSGAVTRNWCKHPVQCACPHTSFCTCVSPSEKEKSSRHMGQEASMLSSKRRTVDISRSRLFVLREVHEPQKNTIRQRDDNVSSNTCPTTLNFCFSIAKEPLACKDLIKRRSLVMTR